MNSNILDTTIEAILSALHLIEAETDDLLDALPAEMAQDSTATGKHLNNIYSALRDARTLTHGAYELAVADVPERIAEIETAKEHLAHLREAQ